MSLAADTLRKFATYDPEGDERKKKALVAGGIAMAGAVPAYALGKRVLRKKVEKEVGSAKAKDVVKHLSDVDLAHEVDRRYPKGVTIKPERKFGLRFLRRTGATVVKPHRSRRK